MIIPSIDLMGGQAVQLVGGKTMAIEAGDPVPIATKFRLTGEIAVIDLDQAMSQGSNRELVQALVRIAPCRVGGGIRSVQAAREWLDTGAAKVILGTAATPEILDQLPRERVIAALDARDGQVVVEGWKKDTGMQLLERIAALKDHVGGFLVTFVESEGRLQGIDMDRVRQVIDAAAPVRVTIAGGVTTPQNVAEIDRLGADAQVGMALYTGRMTTAQAVAACMTSDRPDGLWPTVVTDERGVALGLAYSDAESLEVAVRTGRGVYKSRKRGLWIKGESSGATQELLKIDMDCDRDTLRFTVRQAGQGFCHRDTRTCWGDDAGLGRLSRLLTSRLATAPAGSYTFRLLNDPRLLRAKLIEEAGELADAVTRDEVVWETADVMYFAMVAMVRRGATLAEVETELDRRAGRTVRRPGDAKEALQ